MLRLASLRLTGLTRTFSAWSAVPMGPPDPIIGVTGNVSPPTVGRERGSSYIRGFWLFLWPNYVF